MPVDFLVGRGRWVMAAAFVLAAALFATGAVAFVIASRDDKPAAGPRVHPSLIIPTPEPTQTPSPTPSPTPTATPTPTSSATPVVTPTATPTHSASPAPRVTSSPKPKPTKTVVAEGLSATASIDLATGGQPGDTYHVTGHATDGDGTIYLKSVDWGDGTFSVLNQRGTACSSMPKAPADCRNYATSHVYTKPGTHSITVTFVSGAETQVLHLSVKVSPAPTPSPTHT
jgi:hypothetical protein